MTSLSAPRTTLTTRLLTVSLSLYLGVVVLLTLAESLLVAAQTRQTAHDQVNQLVGSLVPSLEIALWNFNESQSNVILSAIAHNRSVARCVLKTDEGVDERLGSDGEPVLGREGTIRYSLSFADSRGAPKDLGTLTVWLSQKAVSDRVLQSLAVSSIRSLLVMVLISVVLVMTANRLVGRPLARLTAQIDRLNQVGTPRAGLVAGAGAGTELVAVVAAINRLLDELFRANTSLEEQVALRTAHLQETIRELTTTQDRLIDSAKLAVLGQLVAGIAHDLNSPLGASLSAASNAREVVSRVEAHLGLPELGFGLPREAVFDSQLSRRTRAWASTLRNEGIEPVESLAEALAELQREPPLGPLATLLSTTEGRRALETARLLWQLAGSIEIISIANQKMSAVVNQLLRYARKEADGVQIESDLTEQLKNVLQVLSMSLRSGIEVVRSFPSSAPFSCRPDHLQQVWMNLITNAIQAMEGKGRLEIEILTRADEYVVSFSNNGPPIPPETAEKLFLPFFTTKPLGKGTGLGLSICRRIVEEHGGQITLTSVPEKTTFVVTLPRQDVTRSRSEP